MGNQIIKFGVVGGIGFVVDGSVLTFLCSSVVGMNVYLSRFFSFFVAVFVTWLLNRKFTFDASGIHGQNKKVECINYYAIQIAGALINLILFSLMVSTNKVLLKYPVLPLGIAAGVVMVFNFLGLKFWVYRKIKP